MLSDVESLGVLEQVQGSLELGQQSQRMRVTAGLEGQAECYAGKKWGVKRQDLVYGDAYTTISHFPWCPYSRKVGPNCTRL